MLPFARFNSHIGMYSSIQPLIVKGKGTPKRIKPHENMTFNSYYITKSSNTSKNDRNPRIINHPSAKGTEPILYIINQFTNKDDIVLDPFIGSGTTAVACKITSRHYIGFEIDSNYCNLCKERLNKTVSLRKWI